jgi:hypothetical protein
MALFENSVLRKIFGTKREEVRVGWNCIMRNLVIFTAHHILIGR